MNDEISTEEQEQVKHIISRWRKVNLKLAIPVFLASIVPLIVLETVSHKYHMSQPLHDFIFFAIMMPCCSIHPLVSRWNLKKVVRSLSEDERKMLARSANTIQNSDEEEAVCKALKHYRFHPQKELLRPSERKDDTTLLRAATQTEDTAQEQLLRLTQSHDV